MVTKKKHVILEEDEEEFVIPSSVVELSDLIEFMFENKGKGRPTKEWKEKINILIKKCNLKANLKIYREVV